MTQVELARKGIVSPQVSAVAEEEGIDTDFLLKGLTEGKIVIPVNNGHQIAHPCGIGSGLRIKVNANIGTSSDCADIAIELEKLKVVIDSKADAVMDLSTGGDINAVRRAILAATTIPLGTVPIYQAAVRAISERGAVVKMTADDIFNAIEQQAVDGVDFMTVHCGVTQASISRLKKEGRLVDIVSRGGAFLTAWILHNERDNPLYEEYDRLLEIARKYDVTLSLGDGMRPGCIADASDHAQFQELIILGELVKRAREAGVQVMVEGPGHVPLNQIVANMQIEKTICDGAPFYVLGPLVTDIAAGYDHIAGAIGGALAATAGADFLCYVTPAEHLGLPTVDDVREGIIASRIAAHAADIANGVGGAAEQDRRMSRARKDFDWEEQARLSLNPDLARQVHAKIGTTGRACSMCGNYCAMEIVGEYLHADEKISQTSC